MQDAAINVVGLAAATAGPNFLQLFLQSDVLTKAVMLLLLLASVWSWAVIIDKSLRLMRLVRRAKSFERQFWSGAPLDDLYRQLAKRPDHPMALMFATAMEEWRESPKTTDVSFNRGLVGRIGQVMDLTRDREVGSLEANLSWLGTVASTAPFLGLLGTVWGIMNSFEAIAATKNSTLAVVAPGIAEALFTTALGLIAAIPALIAYNKLSGSIDSYANRLSSFSEEFAVVLSRELDAAKVT
jgi:biopolymer transport protein TolQ